MSRFSLQGRGVQLAQSLMFSAFYGTYYFYAVSPHTIYLAASGGMSLFLLIGVLNSGMNAAIYVSEMSLLPGGQ